MRADGAVEFVRQVTTWHTVGNEDEAFYLRVYGTGDYRYKGADMGVVVDARVACRPTTGELTERAKRWATGITSLFAGTAGRRAAAAARARLHEVVLTPIVRAVGPASTGRHVCGRRAIAVTGSPAPQS